MRRRIIVFRMTPQRINGLMKPTSKTTVLWEGQQGRPRAKKLQPKFSVPEMTHAKSGVCYRWYFRQNLPLRRQGQCCQAWNLGLFGKAGAGARVEIRAIKFALRAL